jgi:hypothetical protein
MRRRIETLQNQRSFVRPICRGLQEPITSARTLAILVFVGQLVLSIGLAAVAQSSAARANSDPTYLALRNSNLGGEAVNVTNFDLKRDAGTFHLHTGTVCFVAAVNDKVTSAIFRGDGNFVLDPPSANEKNALKQLTRESEFSETFNQLVLRFTDSTYDEIKKAGSAASGGCDAGPLRDSQNAMRHQRTLRHNLESRILEDVESGTWRLVRRFHSRQTLQRRRVVHH